MKAFQLSADQVARVIGAAAADELARRFNRHFDFLTIASWSQDTALRGSGLGLTEEEIAACAARAAAFFGCDGLKLSLHADKIEDWAKSITEAAGAKLTHFSFKSAARSDDQSLCIHRADEIFQDGAAAANLLYGRRRLLSFVAPHSLLGFELSVLAPNLLHIESVDCRRMTPDELTHSLKYGDVLIATPTLWRYMMRENLASPDNTMAVSFGEPMTPDLAAEMRKAGFGVLRELYGSTESGLIGWRDDPSEPFILFDHWRKEDSRLMRLSPSGQAAQVDAMDIFDWIGERQFRLMGRRDGAVQVGAVNVFPDDVAKILAEHKKIAECRITVGRRGDGASRLIANIVLKEGEKPDEATAREIDSYCREKLRQQERPRIYNFERSITAQT